MTGDAVGDAVADIRSRIAAAAMRSGRDPASITLVAATKTQTCLDVPRMVEIVHRIQLPTEATGWHYNLHDIRKFPLDGFLARAAFIASHGLEISAQGDSG